MTYIDAGILGAIEGITEFLPISSTGHLLLANIALGNVEEFSKTFAIAIQSGAMIAVIAYTWREWLKPTVWTRVLAGFIPTAVIGLLLYRVVKAYLYAPWVVIAALALGGLLMLVFERWYTKRAGQEAGIQTIEQITHEQAAAIGLVQSLAVIPGVSRSAATIMGGMAFGIPRSAIVLYSFLLAVPTIGAATAYDLWKQRAFLAEGDWGSIVFGAFVSAMVAGVVIRWLLRYIRRHSFTVFAYERLAVAFLAWWFFLR